MSNVSFSACDGVDLTGLSIFVGGPIQHAIQHDGFYSPLRTAIHDIIELVQVANGTVFSAHVAEKFGDATALFSPGQVAVRDLNWMRLCDVFVPVLPVHECGDLLRTDGTHIELGWASALDKPIVVVTETPLALTASHLLRGLSSVARVRVFDIARVRHNRAALLREMFAATRDAAAPTG